MERKDHIDGFGAAALVVFAAVLGFNQVVIKVVNDGLQPVFAAGLRSAGAVVLLFFWMKWRGIAVSNGDTRVRDGLLMGTLFAVEFVFLFIALDLTTVVRTSVIFYSMPVWTALLAHLLLPSERMTGVKAMGLALAMAGVAWAMLDRPAGGEASLLGDLLALAAAFCWTAIALLARVSSFARLPAEMQLFWQVSVSAVLLLAVAPLFGPFVRDFVPLHAWAFAFQVVVVVTGAFLAWFWLLKIYPAAGVASFGFLAPIFGVGFGAMILGETVNASLIGALGLVVVGLILINRTARKT